MQTHIKSRSQHPLYPKRFTVPDDKISWSVEYDEYTPIDYTSPRVLENPVWAHPNDPSSILNFEETISYTTNDKLILDSNNFPINPIGRTGMKGRGLLGKWGPNFAADPIVTRWRPDTTENIPEFIGIKRKDTGECAIPGGMVDPGESVSQTLLREFKEEAQNCENSHEIKKMINDLFSPQNEELVHRGYVDDPRNTDNAWMETTAVHYHCSDILGATLNIGAGDDAADVKWIPMLSKTKLYASHKDFIIQSLANMLPRDGPY